jgi:nanoRNase/pAp phosphatase (c-di-AMP/oligoRNAs hydrolase)
MGRLKVESKLTWIDHHKTAIADNDYTIRGVREIGKAACELTWNYFNDDSMPLGVHLLGRYDVWDHSNPNAIDYEEGIQTYEVDPAKNMKIWERVFSNHCEFDDYVLQSGRAIREYNSNRDIRKNATLSFTAEIAGIRVIAANNLCNSKFFDCSFDPNYHDAMCAFYLGKKGSWKYSLYSPKIDCSVVAQQFGGGGHAGAAGFVHRDYLLRRIDD